MKLPCRAYIDIETTGLDRYRHEVTVVGICLEQGRSREVLQFYDASLSRKSVLDAVKNADTLYTFNGERFDLPFIEHRFRLNLARRVVHCDLMHHCWRRNPASPFSGPSSYSNSTAGVLSE